MGLDHPLTGIASLAGALRRVGHEVRILDLNVELFDSMGDDSAWLNPGRRRWSDASFLRRIEPFVRERLLEFLAGDRPLDVLGFHVTAAGRTAVDFVASCVGRIKPELDLIAGGPEYFVAASDIQPPTWARAVFCGESEVSLVNWLARPRSRSRVVVRTLPAVLDELPVPDFDRFPLKLYRRSGVLPVESSRGCGNRCAFCDDVVMWGSNRRRSFPLVVDHLSYVVAKGATHVAFSDSILNPTKRRLAGLCEVMERFDVTWDGMAQTRGIDETAAERAARSGCADLYLGVESFQPDFLKRLGKSSPSSNAERAIVSLASVGVGVSVGLIVAGPPLQDRAEFEFDLSALRRIAPSLKSVAINPLSVPYGGKLHRIGARLGIRGLGSSDSWRYWHAGSGLRDVERRLGWCVEVARTLEELGLLPGADCNDLEGHFGRQIEEARIHFDRETEERRVLGKDGE